MNVVTDFLKFDDEDRGNIDYEGGKCPCGIHRAEKDHRHVFFSATTRRRNKTALRYQVWKTKALSCILFYIRSLSKRMCYVTGAILVWHVNFVTEQRNQKVHSCATNRWQFHKRTDRAISRTVERGYNILLHLFYVRLFDLANTNGLLAWTFTYF